MESFSNDLRVAFRSLLARPAFALAAILTLALGIGSTTTVFSVVFGVLIRPLPFPQSHRLLSIWQTNIQNPVPASQGVSSPVNDDDWRRARTLESVALFAPTSLVLNEGQEPEVLAAAMVTPHFFRALRRTPILGREFTEEEDRVNGPDAVVISHGLWKERFAGAPNIVGRNIRLSGRVRPIVGVAPDGFDFPNQARVWVPVKNNDENCGRGCVYLSGLARLKDGAALTAAQQELGAIAEQVARDFPDSGRNRTFRATTLQEAIVGDVQRPLYVLLGAILMVLLVACANVANLMLVRGSARRAEIAVRSTLGASRGRLVRQLLTESLVLALLGGLLGVLVANWALSGVLALSPGNLPRLNEVKLGLPALLFTLGLTAMTALTFGLVPAFQMTRLTLANALRSGGRGETGPGHTMGRSLLLVGEVAFSVVLLIGAGLLVRSFVRIQSIDLGFQPQGVAQFSMSLPDARYGQPEQVLQFYDQLQTRLRALRGVEDVSIAMGAPLDNNDIVSSFRRLDRPPPEPGVRQSMVLRAIDPAFLSLLRIPIVAGRNFTTTDRHGAQDVALITRTAAERYWRGESPIGKQVEVGVWLGYERPGALTIVGVVDDIRGTGLTTQPMAELWVAQAQSAASSVTVMLRVRGDLAPILTQAGAELRRIDPALPLRQPGAMTDFVQQRLASPRFYMTLLAAFAVLAVILAAIGIYGVVAYLVAQRTREIGVRIALGARVTNVVRLVLWQGMRPALIGIAAGTTGALAVAQVMNKLVYDIGVRDPVTFVGVPFVVIATVFAACILPARRAGNTPPAIALRAEQV